MNYDFFFYFTKNGVRPNHTDLIFLLFVSFFCHLTLISQVNLFTLTTKCSMSEYLLVPIFRHVKSFSVQRFQLILVVPDQSVYVSHSPTSCNVHVRRVTVNTSSDLHNA